MDKLESHHLFWTRSEWSERPISKQVRKMATYIISISRTHHSLLHATMSPPEVPDIETLRTLRENAYLSLDDAISSIDHPIALHVERQLEIISMDIQQARDFLDSGNYRQLRDYNNTVMLSRYIRRHNANNLSEVTNGKS